MITTARESMNTKCPAGERETVVLAIEQLRGGCAHKCVPFVLRHVRQLAGRAAELCGIAGKCCQLS